MSARDELAEDLRDVFEGGDLVYDDMASALMLRGYRKSRTITKVEEIKALPALTMVVHDDIVNGGPLEAYVVPDDGTVMFKDRYPFHLLCMNGEYVDAEEAPLPLTVVYEVGA